MKANNLQFEQVYKCSDGVNSQLMMYNGMQGDGYMFRPYNEQVKACYGETNVLTDKEVSKIVKSKA